MLFGMQQTNGISIFILQLHLSIFEGCRIIHVSLYDSWLLWIPFLIRRFTKLDFWKVNHLELFFFAKKQMTTQFQSVFINPTNRIRKKHRFSTLVFINPLFCSTKIYINQSINLFKSKLKVTNNIAFKKLSCLQRNWNVVAFQEELEECREPSEPSLLSKLSK